MKKMSAIVLFFCCNALLIFFEVHKQGQYLKLSYEVQKLQAEICNLTKQQNDLVYELHALQQPDIIKDTAEKKLGMKPIELKNIRHLADNEALEAVA
ncbi:MAG: hypothetical protein Q8Q60_04405 [Candidatus Chromulinivorax sp.]|nr:hypothetical protein [Candidatus Chromulinivorax sp.]